MFAALSWQVGIALVLTWLIVAKVFRISSLAALSASVLAPLYVWWLTDHRSWLIMTFVVMLLLLWRHRGNIQRLLSGGESTIGKGAENNEN
jgi:glycerol-3-phosphate acyltransferase PlsY